MTNEDLRNAVRNPDVAAQLLDKLPKLPEGMQTVTVKEKSGRKRDFRVVRLQRFGNKLKRSQAASESADE